MTRLITSLILSAAVAGVAQAGCAFRWKAEGGDTCQTMAADWSITTADFIKLNNAAVGDMCQNGVKAGQSYCVEYRDDNSIPTTTTTTSAVPSTTGGVPSPRQPGLVSNCQRFYKAIKGDTCQGIVSKQGTFTLDDFFSWNPAVKSDCSGLWTDYYYCIGVPTTTTSSPASTTPTSSPISTTTTTVPITPPSPTQSGITPDCKEYYQVRSGDICAAIIEKYNNRFDLAKFTSWNPAVQSDCSALWVGFYVCVGI